VICNRGTRVWGFSRRPIYPPFAWLVGLALLGQRLYWRRTYRWWTYLIPAAVFMEAHVGHALLAYAGHEVNLI
jgi:hypothetical protein